MSAPKLAERNGTTLLSPSPETLLNHMRRSRLVVVSFLPFVLGAPSACRDGTAPSSAQSVLWRATLPVDPQQIWIGRPAADPNRAIIEAGNQLFALDAANGQVVWRHTVRMAPTPAPTMPLIDAGRVYLAEVDSTFAFDAATGAVAWTFHPDSGGVAAPAIDASTLYIGQRGMPTVYALDKVSGALRWRRNLGAGYVYEASVRGLAVRGDTVYATVWRFKAIGGALSSGVLVALDRVDGHELWRYETPGDRGSFVTEPLLLPDLIIVNDNAGTAVLGIDPRTRSVRWRSPTVTAYMAYANGTIYGGGANGNAYAMNAATGVVQWTKAIGSSAFGLALCGGSVWVNNGNLHRLDAASGAERGRFDPSRADTFGSDVGTSGQAVFVAGGAGVTAVACTP